MAQFARRVSAAHPGFPFGAHEAGPRWARRDENPPSPFSLAWGPIAGRLGALLLLPLRLLLSFRGGREGAGCCGRLVFHPRPNDPVTGGDRGKCRRRCFAPWTPHGTGREAPRRDRAGMIQRSFEFPARRLTDTVRGGGPKRRRVGVRGAGDFASSGREFSARPPPRPAGGATAKR